MTNMSSNIENDLLNFLKNETQGKEDTIKSLPKTKLTKAWKLVQQLNAILSPKKDTNSSECATKRKRGRPRKHAASHTNNSVLDNKDSNHPRNKCASVGLDGAETTIKQAKDGDTHSKEDLDYTDDGRCEPTGPSGKARICFLDGRDLPSTESLKRTPCKRPQRKATSRFQEVLKSIRKAKESDVNYQLDDDGNSKTNCKNDEDYNQDKELSKGTIKHTQNSDVCWKTLPVASVVEISHQNVMSDHLLPPDNTGMPFAKHVKGPTKLTEAEVDFYEKCRTSDRLGWMCPKCKRILNNRANLRVHMRTHTGEKPYRCNLCEKSFAVKVNYSRHVNMHNQSFRCEVCGRVCGSEGLLHAHIEKIHKGKGAKVAKMIYYCTICQRRFHSEGLWHRHLKANHGIDRQFECSQCDRKFEVESVFNKHCLAKHPESKDSGDSRQDGKVEVNHSDTINKEPPQENTTTLKWHCQTCGKTLSGQGSYLNHKAKHLETAKFACQYCPASFRWKVSLKNHERRHTGEKPYSCERADCDKTFRTATALARHRPVHLKSKHFKCSFCDKLFSYALTLKRHIDAVHNKKRTKCKICDMKFSYSTNLWRHMKYHHSEKNSKCVKCHRKFALPYDLKKHMATHDNFRPYPCHLCSKRFKRQDLLSRHIKQHNGIPTYPCRKCDQKFVTRRQKDKHMKTCLVGADLPILEAAASNEQCKQLGITSENIAGVRHLVVDPNSVQDKTNINIDCQDSISGVISGIDELSGTQQLVLQTQPQQLILPNEQAENTMSFSATAQEEGQTIILFVSDESQIPLDSVVIEEADFQQQFGTLLSNSSELTNYEVIQNVAGAPQENPLVVPIDEEMIIPEQDVV